MSWQQRIGASIGIVAIALGILAVIAPGQILRYSTPTAERLFAQQPLQPAIAILLAVYASWMVFSRGWFAPIRKELTVSTATDSENADGEPDTERTDEEADSDSTGLDASANAPESISFFGRDILTFSSQTETKEAAESKGSTTTADTEPKRPNSAAVEEPNPPVPAHAISISPDEFEDLQSKAPEQPHTDEGAIVGAEFDERFQKGVRLYPQRDDLFIIFDINTELDDQSALPYRRPEDTVRSRVVSLAEKLERSKGESAAPRGDITRWASDAAVKSFLDLENEDSLTLLDRIRVWLTPGRMFERTVEGSIKRLEEIDDGRGDQ